MSSPGAGKKKGHGRRARKKVKTVSYYEKVYPERKLRHLWYATCGKIKVLREWAEKYKTPSGGSGIGALVKLAKELKFNP